MTSAVITSMSQDPAFHYVYPVTEKVITWFHIPFTSWCVMWLGMLQVYGGGGGGGGEGCEWGGVGCV